MPKIPRNRMTKIRKFVELYVAQITLTHARFSKLIFDSIKHFNYLKTCRTTNFHAKISIWQKTFSPNEMTLRQNKCLNIKEMCMETAKWGTNQSSWHFVLFPSKCSASFCFTCSRVSTEKKKKRIHSENGVIVGEPKKQVLESALI